MWLYNRGFPMYNYHVCFTAALEGHIPVLEWMKEHGRLEADRVLYEMAALRDQLNVVKWLREQGLHSMFWDAKGCNAAAKYQSQETFQWLIEEGCPWNAETGVCAVHSPGVGVLPFLKEKGYPHWTAEICIEAASKWNFEALQWLREIGCPWNDLCYSAAITGLKDRQQLLNERNIPWSKLVERGRLEFAPDADIVMMKWLRENGCPITAETSAKVAETGRLEALKWLRESGCSWDSRTMAAAKKNNDDEMLQWLSENGCPSS